MLEQFDSNSVSDSKDSHDPRSITSSSSNDDLPDDEHICKHCGNIVPPGSVLCPDCGCWWTR